MGGGPLESLRGSGMIRPRPTVHLLGHRLAPLSNARGLHRLNRASRNLVDVSCVTTARCVLV